jgi:hypothetical protein
MKVILLILSAVVLSSTIALAATGATDSIACYSGGVAVFTDATVNFPVIVAPITFGDPNDIYSTTDSATGVTTSIGGPGTVCVVTYVPATSTSSSSKVSTSTVVHPGLARTP